MNKKLLIFLFLGMTLYLVGCHSPLNVKYNESTMDKDLKAILDSKKVDSIDIAYIGMYIIRAKMLGEKLDEKTYNDILANAKELRKEKEKEGAEQKALAAKAALEEKIKSERFNKLLSVALYHKGYEEGDYQNYLTYDLVFQNKSNKGIRAFKGQFKICDLFDSEIKTINFTIDDPIAANSTFKNSYTTDYNQFLDEDQRLKSKNLSDLKTIWVCEKIIFDDGTTLE